MSMGSRHACGTIVGSACLPLPIVMLLVLFISSLHNGAQSTRRRTLSAAAPGVIIHVARAQASKWPCRHDSRAAASSCAAVLLLAGVLAIESSPLPAGARCPRLRPTAMSFSVSGNSCCRSAAALALKLFCARHGAPVHLRLGVFEHEKSPVAAVRESNWIDEVNVGVARISCASVHAAGGLTSRSVKLPAAGRPRHCMVESTRPCAPGHAMKG